MIFNPQLPCRLDKFLREATHLSLTEVRSKLRCGAVCCDRLGPPGTPLDPETTVFDSDDILLSGSRLSRKIDHFTYLLNKPKNVTTTTRDPRGQRDVSEWLSQMNPGTFPVGRLDRETTGALLFTSDGDLATAVLRPEHDTAKTYWLWLNESFSSDDPRLSAFLEGVPMLKAVGRASRVEILTSNPDWTELLVTLHEGKNRQIRRMCHALDLRLLHLHRRSIATLDVSELPVGQHRQIADDELERLWASVGGRSRVRLRQYEALVRLARNQRTSGAPDELLESWLNRNTIK